jgi:hypothetical protein
MLEETFHVQSLSCGSSRVISLSVSMTYLFCFRHCITEMSRVIHSFLGYCDVISQGVLEDTREKSSGDGAISTMVSTSKAKITIAGDLG